MVEKRLRFLTSQQFRRVRAAIRWFKCVATTVLGPRARRIPNCSRRSTGPLALGRLGLFSSLYPRDAEMQVMSLDPQLERVLQQAIAGGGENVSIEPGLAETLIRAGKRGMQRQEELGLPAVPARQFARFALAIPAARNYSTQGAAAKCRKTRSRSPSTIECTGTNVRASGGRRNGS